MLNLRVRLVNDNGTVDATSRVLDTQGITYTAVENSSPTLKFNVSRGSFVPAAYPFVVRVEYAVDGGRYKELPEHSLFIVEKDSDDSKDVAQVATYEGEGFVPWLLRGSLLKWTTSTKQGKRTFLEAGGKASSAGHTLNIMISEMKAGGWFPALNWSFAGAKDSAGQTWAADEKSVLEWEVTKTIAAVLEQFVKDGMCDWSTSGATLKVFRPGTAGIQRPETVLGGADFTRVPVRMDSSGLYSHVRAAPDNLPWQNYEADSQIRRRFGHRSIFLSQSGVKDKASSRRHAQPYLDSGKKLQREESYEWEPGAGAVHPWRDFGLSDMVTARARGGKLQRRVIGIIVTVDSDGTAKVQARVGEVLKGRAARDRDRLGSVAVGGAIGGTGSAFPASPGQAAIAPARPNALRAVTNTGVWREDGTAVSAVELAWEAVTADAEGGEIDISHYEVWSRTTSGMLARDVTVTDPATTIESWTPGLDRVIVVYAVSAEGVKSKPSLDLVLTPFYPLSIVPKPPTGFAVVSNTGKWTAAGPSAEVVLRFDAVTESTDGELVEISEYEVLDELGAVARVESAPATVRQATGASATYRVRARSSFGIWGDVSDPVSVVGAAPALVARAPSLPSLTTGAGVVIARWDGRYSVADTDGAFTVRVEQYTDMQWAYVGTALTGAGTVSIQSKPGDTVFVRLSAFDQMNRLTGTSAQVSIVAEGIELVDIGDELASRIESIMLTPDGLNRIFATTDHPGDYWIGEGENLALPIVGSGEFVERHRNRVLNSMPSLSIDKWAVGAGGAWGNADGGGRQITNTAEVTAENSLVATRTPYPAIASGQPFTYSVGVRNDGATVTPLRISTYQRDAAGVSSGTINGEWVSLLPGESRTLQVSGVTSATTVDIRFSIRVGGGGTVYPAGSVLTFLDGVSLVESATSPGLFSGGLDSPEPDMRARFLGDVNASEAVLEIERVAGWVTTSTLIAAVSYWDGKPAIRLINTAPAGNNGFQFIWCPVPEAARGGGVFFGTRHQQAPFTLLPTDPRAMLVRNPDHFARFENAAGSTKHRVKFAPVTSGNQAFLYHGGGAGEGDVYWTGVGMLPGEPNEADYLALKNGDMWWRLGSNGEVVEILIWNGQAWRPYEIVADSIIATGSIMAKHVQMDEGFADKFWANEANFGRIRADFLEPNVGEVLNLGANESIILMAGRQDAQESAIGAAQETATESAKRVAELGAVFRVTPTGADVASRDFSNMVSITPDGVAIVQGGSTISAWTGGQFTVDEAIVAKAQLANHSIEKAGTGHTIIRPL